MIIIDSRSGNGDEILQCIDDSDMNVAIARLSCDYNMNENFIGHSFKRKAYSDPANVLNIIHECCGFKTFENITKYPYPTVVGLFDDTIESPFVIYEDFRADHLAVHGLNSSFKTIFDGNDEKYNLNHKMMMDFRLTLGEYLVKQAIRTKFFYNPKNALNYSKGTVSYKQTLASLMVEYAKYGNFLDSRRDLGNQGNVTVLEKYLTLFRLCYHSIVFFNHPDRYEHSENTRMMIYHDDVMFFLKTLTQ